MADEDSSDDAIRVDDTHKIQFNVDAYTKWVLDHLVGVKGRNPGDVAYYILRDWIRSNREELASLGITIEVAGGRLFLKD